MRTDDWDEDDWDEVDDDEEDEWDCEDDEEENNVEYWLECRESIRALIQQNREMTNAIHELTSVVNRLEQNGKC